MTMHADEIAIPDEVVRTLVDEDLAATRRQPPGKPRGYFREGH
jgi:hypothetical protein